MKKLLLIVALAASCVAMSAQGLEGKWFVGGKLGYNHVKGTTIVDKEVVSVKGDRYEIMPTIGKFISSDVAVGASLGYAGGKNLDDYFTIAPFARKYWALGNSGFNFFGEVALPVGFGDDVFGLQVQLNPGIDYVINEKWSFETSLNLLNLGYSKMGDNKTYGINANPNTKIGEMRIGFKFLF